MAGESDVESYEQVARASREVGAEVLFGLMGAPSCRASAGFRARRFVCCSRHGLVPTLGGRA